MNEEIRQQIVALVQAAYQGNQEAAQQIQQIYDKAKKGDEQSIAIMQVIEQEAQKLKGGQVAAARHGAKLDYIKSLKHQCPDGEELYYFKKGGKVGCGCKKKEDGGKVEEKKENAITKFKNRNKVEKKSCGSKMNDSVVNKFKNRKK